MPSKNVRICYLGPPKISRMVLFVASHVCWFHRRFFLLERICWVVSGKVVGVCGKRDSDDFMSSADSRRFLPYLISHSVSLDTFYVSDHELIDTVKRASTFF